jgi:hypothetical protein
VSVRREVRGHAGGALAAGRVAEVGAERTGADGAERRRRVRTAKPTRGSHDHNRHGTSKPDPPPVR